MLNLHTDDASSKPEKCPYHFSGSVLPQEVSWRPVLHTDCVIPASYAHSFLFRDRLMAIALNHYAVFPLQHWLLI